MILLWKKSCTTCFPREGSHSTYQLAEGEGCFYSRTRWGASWNPHVSSNTLYIVNVTIFDIDVWYVILMLTCLFAYVYCTLCAYICILQYVCIHHWNLYVYIHVYWCIYCNRWITTYIHLWITSMVVNRDSSLISGSISLISPLTWKFKKL